MDENNMKQQQLIKKVNTITPCLLDVLKEVYGSKAIEGLLSKGLLHRDEHGYCRLTDRAYQLKNVRFA
ncbi:MAG: hypothetical protein KAI17_10075 [Thiotrichaceae bacterium]|nr:hypothetical protein [Thiotrichaceae bacterium]